MERGFWDDYVEAYENAIASTSTEEAPWYIVPADNKWVTRAVVADVLTSTIRELPLEYPELTDQRRAVLAAAREKLISESP